MVAAKAPDSEAVFASATEETSLTAPECAIDTDFSVLSAESGASLNKIIALYGCEKIASLAKIEVYDDLSLPRAFAGARTLKLRADLLENSAELEAVLVHELAHTVDLGYFRGSAESGKSVFFDGSLPIFNDDPSLAFYTIAWENSTKLKEGIMSADFVSGYARSDPFEDFAETVVYYVNHNREFRIMASRNAVLAKKYNFVRQQVFGGRVFRSGKSFVDAKTRVWDATKE